MNYYKLFGFVFIFYAFGMAIGGSF